MAKHRAVILGCGPRSDWHVRAYDLVGNATMVACCDAIDERRERFEAEYGLRGYSDPGEMIRKEQPDLIHVVTRPGTRVEQLSLVSELGVPACIVEKPIALGASDWRAIRSLSETTKTKIAVGAQWRYSPYLARCREALNSGRLGRPLFTEATAVSSICDQGVHVLDWISSLNGESPVKRVFGAIHGTEELDTTQPGPRTATAQMVFENGVGCGFTIGLTAPEVATSYEAIGRYSHCRVAVYCENGRVLFEEFGRWQVVSADGTEGGETTSMDEWQRHNDRSQASLTEAVCAWLDDDAKPADTNLPRALAQWNAILGVYASGIWGRPVELPFDAPDDLFEQMAAHLRRRAEASSSD